MDKRFRLALIVGRFQTLHKGHEDMVAAALACAQRVGILVGSAQESGTEKNPFSYEMREEMLRTVFGDRVTVAPLRDIGVGNCAAWGTYVLVSAEEAFGEKPDLVVSGQEERRTSWYENEAVAELFIPKTVDMSASRMREFFEQDDRASFEKYSDPALYDHYEVLRDAVLRARGVKKTDSI